MQEAPDTLSAPADAGEAMLALPAELTIYTAAELHPQWLHWLDTVTAEGSPATVQASAVDQVDAAGLQLLLSLAQALAEREQVLRLHAPSGALQQACDALGLQGWLHTHARPPLQATAAGAAA